MRVSTLFRGLLLLLALAHLLSFTVLVPQIGTLRPTVAQGALLAVTAIIFAVLVAPLFGLWFYQRWARVIFVIELSLTMLSLAFPHRRHLDLRFPFVFIEIRFLMHVVQGAVVAMMFLPPIRDLFAKRSNQAMQPTASPRTASDSHD